MISLRRAGVRAIASDESQTDTTSPPTADDLPPNKQPNSRKRAIAYIVLPVTVLLLALGAGFLKWKVATTDDAQDAAQESTRVATEATVALLSYQPDTVQTDLSAATGYLTGEFLYSYQKLVDEVVIPGAQEKRISAEATVPAAAAASTEPGKSVVLLFVNQTTTIGEAAPTSAASTIRATLEMVDNRWLISQFEPV